MKRVLSQRKVPAEDIDDLVQEAFHRLENYQRDHVVEHPEGFLVRTAINLSIDLARKRRRQRIADEPIESLVIIDDAPKPDEVLAGRERLRRLSEGFDALDPITRHMIVGQRVEGLSVQEVAARHKLSVSATEKRLSRGLAFLVGWMEGW